MNVISEAELEDRLAASIRAGKPLRVKLGVDPTSSQLHLGFTVVLNKLRAFQDCGHVAVLIIGDATALVGDPTGRNQTRPRLTQAEVDANAETYLEQAGLVLDLPKVEVRRNGEWLGKLGFHGMIELLAKRTAAQILEREDFRTRWDAKTPIFLHEMVYPLLQGRDSVEIQADVELGGTDQLFNLLVGRDLQADAGQPPQICMTLPILPGLDGVQKMSKSYGNTIGAHRLPGRHVREGDERARRARARLLHAHDAGRRTTEIARTARRRTRGTRRTRWGARSSRGTTARTRREAAADRFRRVFSEKQVPDEMPELAVPSAAMPDGSIGILDLVVLAQFAKSKSDARRLVEQGGVTLDGVEGDGHRRRVESRSAGERCSASASCSSRGSERNRAGRGGMEFDLVLSGGDAVVGGRVERLNIGDPRTGASRR